MKLTLLVAVAVVSAGILNDAAAKPIDVPEGEPVVTIDFPEGWVPQHMDLSLLTGTPQGDLGMVFELHMAGTNASQQQISESLNQVLTESTGLQIKGKQRPTEAATIDGAKAYKSGATGTIQKANVAVVAYLLPIAADRSLAFSYWGSAEALKKHEGVIKKIIESIHRKPPQPGKP